MPAKPHVTKRQFLDALTEARGDVRAAGKLLGLNEIYAYSRLSALSDDEVPDAVLWQSIVKPENRPKRDRRDREKRYRNARKQIIARYLPLVSATAGSVARNLFPKPSHRALIAMGHRGLLAAINGYDHTKGVQFATYATPRIRGSILDGLEEAGYDQSGLVPDLPARPDTERAQREAEDNIAHLTLGLPPDEWMVIYLHYTKGSKLKYVAEAMALSESRCRQLRGKALDWLQEHITRDEMIEVLF